MLINEMQQHRRRAEADSASEKMTAFTAIVAECLRIKCGR
ncbi:hypothetical protein BHAOGJBA_6003 [Methylobacterium hispanicum]|uniref:Uncharacterized protein n=1 Tax=Methylobacterium hispanicum TaxID=270350 RepID=A0AAV4ZV38_9HYPH|nr:hypothetical protein BHAOGJBA_6003 [Methylobacterium hispanicum]